MNRSIIFAVLIVMTSLAWMFRFDRETSPSRSTPSQGGPGSVANEGGVGPGAQTTIVWVGISGLAPKYIDSGSNKGMGWLEVQTQEIRKTVAQEGFHFKSEYMTPARIAHEFKKGSPICVYPMDWKNPAQRFAQKPDRIYSIPLDLAGDMSRSILVHKDDLHKFKKFMDQKGDVDFDRLVSQSSLRTLLVRDADYGSLSERLLERDDLGEQVVKEEFKKNIALRVIRDNQQLVEMLNARRFDYIFSDALEERNFALSGVHKDQFVKLNFKTIQIRTVDDPELIRLSIACSVHPETLRVMPYLNRKIKAIRSSAQTSKMLSYRKKLDEQMKSYDSCNTLTSRFAGSFGDGSSDRWYALQQKHFPDLALYPKESGVPQTAPLPPAHSVSPLRWYAYEAQGEWTLLTDAEMHLVDSEPQAVHWYEVYNRKNLQQYLAPSLKEKIRKGAFPAATALEFKGILDQLILKFHGESHRESYKTVKKVTLFGGGLDRASLKDFQKVFIHPELESLSAFDLEASAARELVAALPSQLKHLNLTQSDLSQSGLELKVKELQLLSLHLTATHLLEKGLGALLRNLSETASDRLEALSLGYLREGWSSANAEAFSRLSLKHLKSLDLSHDVLGDAAFLKIARVLPKTLKRLILDCNFLTPEGVKPVFERDLSLLTELDLQGNSVVSPGGGVLRFPKALEQLNLVDTGLDLPRAKLLEMPKALREFEIGNDEGDINNPPWRDDCVATLLNQIGIGLTRLKISGTTVRGATLASFLSRQRGSSLKHLDLSSNHLDSKAMEGLLLNSHPLESLNLSNNILDNSAAQVLSRRLPKGLRRLDLSRNLFGDLGVQALSAALPRDLEELNLASIASLDVAALARALPAKLKSLDLASNSITDSEIQTLAPRLSSQLLELKLGLSNFREAGMSVLSEHLPPHLNVLDLGRTPIGDHGLLALSRRLPPSLATLGLGGMSAQSKSVAALAEGLPPRLVSLRFSEIPWKFGSLALLLKRIPSSVQRLTIQNAAFGPEEARSLGHHYPPHLRELNLRGIKPDKLGAAELFKKLPASLESIVLLDTHLGEDGLLALMQNPLSHAFYLHLANDAFGEKSVRALNLHPRRFIVFALMNVKLTDSSLNALDHQALDSVRAVWFSNDPITGLGVTRFLKKLHPETKIVSIPALQLKNQDVARLVRVLPPVLVELTVSGNVIGQNGYNLFHERANQQEFESGVKMLLSE